MAPANPVLANAAARHLALFQQHNAPGVTDAVSDELTELEAAEECVLVDTSAVAISDLLPKAKVLSTLLMPDRGRDWHRGVPVDCPDYLDDIGSLTWSILRDIFALTGGDVQAATPC